LSKTLGIAQRDLERAEKTFEDNLSPSPPSPLEGEG